MKLQAGDEENLRIWREWSSFPRCSLIRFTDDWECGLMWRLAKVFTIRGWARSWPTC